MWDWELKSQRYEASIASAPHRAERILSMGEAISLSGRIDLEASAREMFCRCSPAEPDQTPKVASSHPSAREQGVHLRLDLLVSFKSSQFAILRSAPAHGKKAPSFGCRPAMLPSTAVAWTPVRKTSEPNHTVDMVDISFAWILSIHPETEIACEDSRVGSSRNKHGTTCKIAPFRHSPTTRVSADLPLLYAQRHINQCEHFTQHCLKCCAHRRCARMIAP